MKALGIVLAVAVLAILTQTAFAQEGDSSDRAFLQYEIQKVDPWGPFVINLLLGAGIGSFVQGDTTGGLIVLGGEVVGIGLVIAGATSDPYSGSGGDGGSGLIIVGVAALGVARILGLIFPFTYANAANEKLRMDLGISASSVSLSEDGLNVTLTAALPN